nr:thiamine pyrophosphate-binding protein [Micromonospora sp. DSM 115978]
MTDRPGAAVRLGADLVVQRLRAWRVPRVFGSPGDGVEPLVEALRRTGGEPTFVPVRHEESAGFMATGHAKYTGGIGVCLAGRGPAAVRLLPGLYDAKLDGQPVVAIVGEPAGGPRGEVYPEIEPIRLFGDVCAPFVRAAADVNQVRSLLDQALRTAQAIRGPTCVLLPAEAQLALAPDPVPYPDGLAATAPGLPPVHLIPHERDLNAAAQVLAAGRRVAILVGQGAAGAAEEIVDLADRLGAGIATSLPGKPVLDERLPFHTGVLGQVGSTASAELMGGCDTLLMVGTNDPWTEYYPAPGQAKAVQIDVDGRRLATRYPIDVPLVGDAAQTLRALLDRVPRRPNQDWRHRIERSVDRCHVDLTDRARDPADPVNPRWVVQELSSRLPPGCALSVDVGPVTHWYARHLRLPSGVSAGVCAGLAATGCALPYGLAAKLAAPDRPVIALIGHAATQMTGLAELVTVARCWPDWPDPRFVVLVLNVRDTAGPTGHGGRPSEPEPEVPYAAWARLLGLHGVRVDRPEQTGPAWDEAFAAGRPTVIEAVVDPAVPLGSPAVPLADLRALAAVRSG